MNEDKTKLIEKLEQASNNPEINTFLNHDFSDIKISNINLKENLFNKCNFFVTKFYRL